MYGKPGKGLKSRTAQLRAEHERQQRERQERRNAECQHYAANALPSSPYAVDSTGRVRRNGRFASKP